MGTSRSRTWTFVGYPDDSLPDNWLQIMNEDFQVCGAASPVHDADLNGDGDQKKKHRHFILVFDGMKSYDQIKEITDRLNCPIPQVCRNPRTLVRYFCHLDNPDKAQYRPSDIIPFGGFDYENYLSRSQSELNQIAKEIRDFIRDNNIKEFSDLIDLVDKYGDPDWIDLLQNKMTLFFSQYMKSVYFKYLREKRQQEFDEGKGSAAV